MLSDLTYRCPGPSLERKLKEAIPGYYEHRVAFASFDTALRAVRGDQVQEWEQQLADWEEDNTKPNPYEASKKGTFFNCVVMS